MRSSLILLAFTTLFATRAERVTLHLAGDSTMAAKRVEKRPETGWGEWLQEKFDSSRVRVLNHAQNGRSTRTFISEGRWQAIVDSLQPGDYVFIQFGHNDQSRDKLDRYTPPADFQNNLRRFIRDTRAKNAVPVLLTPIVRRRFDSTRTFYDVHGEYPSLTRAVATELKVALVDVHRSSEALLKSYGMDSSRALFLQLEPGEHPNYLHGVNDNTHFSPLGARLMAELVVSELRKSSIGLRTFLLPVDSVANGPWRPSVEHSRGRKRGSLVPR